MDSFVVLGLFFPDVGSYLCGVHALLDGCMRNTPLSTYVALAAICMPVCPL